LSKEWLAGWLHALYASFVPKADCTFSSIGLTDRSRPARRFVIDRQTTCWPRKILSLSSRAARRGEEVKRAARSRRPPMHQDCVREWVGRAGGRGRSLLVHSFVRGSFDSSVGLALGNRPD